MTTTTSPATTAMPEPIGCCRILIFMANLGFISPGLTEDIGFDPPTWDENMQRIGLKILQN